MAAASISLAEPYEAPSAVLPSYHHQGSLYGTADSFHDDRMFFQGSAYWELHATLRNHMFSTAKSNAPSNATTRQPTPDPDYPSEEQQTSQTGSYGEELRYDSKESELLNQHAEYELWKNWIDEVAPWVRSFPILIVLRAAYEKPLLAGQI